MKRLGKALCFAAVLAAPAAAWANHDSHWRDREWRRWHHRHHHHRPPHHGYYYQPPVQQYYYPPPPPPVVYEPYPVYPVQPSVRFDFRF